MFLSIMKHSHGYTRPELLQDKLYNSETGNVNYIKGIALKIILSIKVHACDNQVPKFFLWESGHLQP